MAASDVREWRGVTPGLMLLIGALLAALFFGDRFLAKTEQLELRRQAVSLASAGSRLLKDGKAADAVDSLQHAHTLFRDDREYALAYATALLQAGQVERAETALREQLDKDSNDGRANLLMARAMIAAKDAANADSYYHRAIYGTWQSDAAANRNAVRLELADWLAERHSKDELLAELLPLEANPGNDLKTKRRVAALFLAAGAPSRAATVYRAMIAGDPKDTAAYAGLGEAELAMGQDYAAERAFRSAGQNDRLLLVSKVIGLDPTPRRLTSIDKYQRSMRLVELSAEALQACGPAAGTELLQQAANLERVRITGAVTNELSEKRLDLAGELWRLRMKSCPGAVRGDDPLDIVMRRLLAI